MSVLSVIKKEGSFIQKERAEMKRERVLIEQDSVEVVDKNKQPFVMIDHLIMDSLYFDSIYQKMVYLTLKRFANWHTLEAYPSRSTLAKLSHCSEGQIKKVIKELEEKKLIEVKERFEGKNQLSNLYIILEYPYELIQMDYKNEGGHTVTPGGSHGNPGGVTRLPRGGHTVTPKDIELKEKDFKEKDLKNDDDERVQYFLNSPEYISFSSLLTKNGFTNLQSKAIQKKFINEKILIQLKPVVIELAIGYYFEGITRTKPSSIASFFHYQFEKALNDYLVDTKQKEKQYAEYERIIKSQTGENENIAFYDWINN